jgi:ribosomal protein S18 acetylase RimI-like enzyme
MSNHPLDHAVWLALSGRQAALSEGSTGARRLRRDIGPFIAARDGSPAALAAMAALVDEESYVMGDEPPPLPGVRVVSSAPGVQMVALDPAPPLPDLAFVDLTDADAPAMLALATLTRPGPFRTGTHRLGGFVGVKQDGRLMAMAGERLKPGSFTEVSGVCTHPGARGQGLAGALMRVVAARIVTRGETPFLHAYASNTSAIALYERLGFRHRRMVTATILARDETSI